MKRRTLSPQLRKSPALLLLSAALALALPGVSGCAGANRETYMREHAGEHVYAMPMPQVWAAAKALLTEEGYSGREVRGGWGYVTEWKESGSGSSISDNSSRYLLEGKELSPTRSTVRFTKITRSAGASASGLGQSESTHAGSARMAMQNADSSAMPAASGTDGIGGKSTLTSGARDLEMEWKLLRRLDPPAASAIEGEAKQKYPGD